eukprot:6244514-Pyramimonas_sp.AAC.1
MPDNSGRRVHFADATKLEAILREHVVSPTFITYGTRPNEDKLTSSAIGFLISRASFLRDIELATPNMSLRETTARDAFRALVKSKAVEWGFTPEYAT